MSLTIQRTGREGAFEARDTIACPIGAAPDRDCHPATAIGRVALTAMTDVLDRVRQPALVLNREGMVLRTNEAADHGFSDFPSRQLRPEHSVTPS